METSTDRTTKSARTPRARAPTDIGPRIPGSNPSMSHPSMSRTRFLATGADTPAARDSLDRWLGTNAPHLDSRRTYEILLAANELFCNAFEHGTGSGCLFDMRRVGDHLTITVTNDAEDPELRAPDDWAMAGVDARNGRGLAIVRTVADKVSTRTSPQTVSIAATFDLRAGTSDTAEAEATLAW